MADTMENRACQLAVYIIENNATIRSAAKHFGCSKSTVHKDLSVRLPVLDKSLYTQVRSVLEHNLAERHIRGGNATKAKFQEQKTLRRAQSAYLHKGAKL